jgi:hypothetical protein
MRASGLVYSRETKMPQSNRAPSRPETGEQIPARPHDTGSGANENVDGLDSTTEALRHAVEDTPKGVELDDVEEVPVFDRADLAPKI